MSLEPVYYVNTRLTGSTYTSTIDPRSLPPFNFRWSAFFDLLHRRRRRRSHRQDILVQYGSDVVGGHGGRVAQQQLWGQRQVWWKQRWTQQAESAHW